MKESMRSLFSAALISLIPTLLIWLPFFVRAESVWGIPLQSQGMGTIVANYDGPLFIATAKTMYDKAQITQNFSFDLPAEYYAAHFPLFPLLIKTLAGVFWLPLLHACGHCHYICLGYLFLQLVHTTLCKNKTSKFFDIFVCHFSGKVANCKISRICRTIIHCRNNCFNLLLQTKKVFTCRYLGSSRTANKIARNITFCKLCICDCNTLF